MQGCKVARHLGLFPVVFVNLFYPPLCLPPTEDGVEGVDRTGGIGSVTCTRPLSSSSKLECTKGAVPLCTHVLTARRELRLMDS